jgi:hypothetical protein
MTVLDDIEAGLKALVQTVIGLLLLVAGLGSLVWEKTHPPTHDAHLLAELVIALLGAAIVPSVGPVLLGALSKIVTLVLSLLPSRPQPPAP